MIDGYDFEGPTRFDKLFTGIAVGSAAARADRPSFIAPGDVTGTEGIGPEDTFDGDYGRLLARAYEKSVKVLASPIYASWNQLRGWLHAVDGLRRAA